jgi:hypothetical protein
MDDLKICAMIITKEAGFPKRSIDKNRLFHKILLKKATSKVIYELVYYDKNNEKKHFIKKHTPAFSKANQVARYLYKN